MKKQKKSMLVLAVIVAFVGSGLFFPGLIGAGDLEPPAGPDDPGSAMYTLEDVYNYLDTGVAGTKRTGGFVEPTLPPGSTGNTIDEVMDKMPVPDDTNGAAPEDVASGKTYWGLRTDGTWGQQTGTHECITCEGTLTGTRWCDQGDGTVKDMTTGLVWLKDASWGGQYAFWVDTMNGTNAHDRAAQAGDWRLPTIQELYGLANGTDPVRSWLPQVFTGVQSPNYWSSTANTGETNFAWFVNMNDGRADPYGYKPLTAYVWPVRGGN